MRNWKRAFVWIVAVTVMLYIVVTGGGMVVDKRAEFDLQGALVLADGLRSEMSLSPTRRWIDIPLLWHYYSCNEPFDLQLRIRDADKRYRSIEITRVLIEYADGELAQLITPWSKELEPSTERQVSSSGVLETEALQLSDAIPRLVLRHADVKITLIGHLFRADGQQIDFRTTSDFKADSESETTTNWELLTGASC